MLLLIDKVLRLRVAEEHVVPAVHPGSIVQL